jgi:hypothetical protein
MSSRWSSPPKKFSVPLRRKDQAETPDRASIWTDTNVYNELGIPAIKIEIDAMVKAAQLHALVALDICSRDQ